MVGAKPRHRQDACATTFIVILTKIEKLKSADSKKFLDFKCLIFILNDYTSEIETLYVG